MRRIFFAWAALGGWMALAGPGRLEAQNAPDTSSTNDTAYVALRLMAKTLGKDALDRVVEVSGRDGSPQPYLWKIVLQDGTAGTREVDVAGGKVVAQRTSPNPPPARDVIHLADLNLDSSGAFDATDAQARKVHLRFDSVSYVLRPNDATGKPQWTLNLLNQESADVGSMRLGANDGNIVSIDGRLANAPATSAPAPATPRPAAVSSGRSSEPTTTVTRPRETSSASSSSVASSGRSTERSTESTTTVTRTRETSTPVPRVVESRTTTTTTTTGSPPPVTTDTVVVEDTSVDREGGLFTRTGRTLDKTSRNVGDTLRRTGSRVQRFFTGGGRSDAPEPPEPPRPPDYRGD